MSVYLALHTSAAPDIGDIAEFGATALRLGADPKTPLAVQRDANGALTVVLPLPLSAAETGSGSNRDLAAIDRLVEVPYSDRDSAWHQAMADALSGEYSVPAAETGSTDTNQRETT